MRSGYDTFRLQPWEEGPIGKGQGGLASYRLSQIAGAELSVRLHAPIPLDAELVASRREDGVYTAYHGDILVLSGTPTAFESSATESVGVETAREARGRSPLKAETHGAVNCISCGLNNNSMGVHPGQLQDGRFATDFIPPEWTIADNGSIDPGVFWMALDCTAGVFVDNSPKDETGSRTVVTAQYQVQITRPRLEPGVYTLVAYDPIRSPGWDGRKRRACSAAFDVDGNLVAQANSFWVALA